MTGEALLKGLLAGEGAACARLLQNARLEGFGLEAFGGEAITALLRRAPVEVAQAEVVACATGAMLVGAGASGAPLALAAELNDGWVTRLWRLGAGGLEGAAAPFVSTPADPDLDQRGARLAFDAGDHAALAPAHAQRLEAWGEAWLRAPSGEAAAALDRPRLLVLRGFSEGARAGALLRVSGGANGGLHGAYAAVMFGEGAEPGLVLDAAGLAASLDAGWVAAVR